MKEIAVRINWIAIVLGIVGIAIPLLVLAALAAGVPSVKPHEAREALAGEKDRALLLDVRTRAEFDDEHIVGAVNIPFDKIEEGDPQTLSILATPGDRRIFVICQSGIRSARATVLLRSRGYSGAINVSGGIEAWIKGAGVKPCPGFCHLQRASGEVINLPFRVMSRLEQYVAFASGFIVKPIYTFLSLIVIILLWRKRTSGLVSLKWAMIFFFVGENFCAANYLFFKDTSVLFELWHSVGMMFCFGFATYALMEGVDAHVMQYSAKAKKCSLLGFCRSCVKYKDVSCGLQKLFLFLCPATAIVALMPIFSSPVKVSYNTKILGTFYNYSHSLLYQWFETRLCPVLAAGLLGVATLVIVLKKREPVPLAKILFAGGMGAMGFSMMRFIIFRCYQENMLWMVFWEEFTELLLVAGVVTFLYVFRKQLKPSSSSPASAATQAAAPYQ